MRGISIDSVEQFQMMEWHIIYTEDGKVKETKFHAPRDLKAAEDWFKQAYPKATYWEIGADQVIGR
jgi:hypothetical protein